jgi:hypothetical protein
MTDYTNVLVGYSPTDFFYVKAQQNNQMPSASVCTTLNPYDTIWDASCNSANYSSSDDNILNCNHKELCKNKDKAVALTHIQHNHIGSDQNHLDTKNEYNTAIVKTVNLGIGIILLIGLIYTNRNI